VRKKRLLLLDRDGTLIEEKHYLKDPEQVRLFKDVPEALRKLRRAGFVLAVTSNQSGVGRGYMSRRQVQRVNQRLIDLLKAKKVAIDGVYWCPHSPQDGCSCRKPKLGLAKRASRDLGIPWKASISIGDKACDVQLGQRTGGIGVLVRTGHGHTWAGKAGADYEADTFKDAVQWILKKTTGAQ
jgi:D-glycero-D-manno-heptose 1,7-bisphosphate phosphatase